MSNWTFKRHLTEPFVEALVAEAAKGGWWSDVLADRDVIVALRDDYLNVYHRGQALFTVTLSSAGRLQATTHPKYLIDPALKSQVRFDGRTYLHNQKQEHLLGEWYDGALSRLKKSAALYSGAEKTGCHVATRGRNDLLDVEIVFRREKLDGDDPARDLPRIDMLRLVPDGPDVAALEFWEAKVFGNKELGSMGYNAKAEAEPNPVFIKRDVLDQIEDYSNIIKQHLDDLVSSYSIACKQLATIYAGHDRFSSDSIIGQVASCDRRLVAGPGGEPQVNLLLFGFDAAQKKSSTAAFTQLKTELAKRGKAKLRAVGDPAGAFA